MLARSRRRRQRPPPVRPLLSSIAPPAAGTAARLLEKVSWAHPAAAAALAACRRAVLPARQRCGIRALELLEEELEARGFGYFVQNK